MNCKTFYNQIMAIHFQLLMPYFIKMDFFLVSRWLDPVPNISMSFLDTEWAKKFKNNKRLQSMKPIDLVSTNLASESGRQEINSFINGKTLTVWGIKTEMALKLLYWEKTNGKIPEMYKDVLDKDTLIALGNFKLHYSYHKTHIYVSYITT